MRAHRLCVCAYVRYLEQTGVRLFDEPIVAWQSGPAVPALHADVDPHRFVIDAWPRGDAAAIDARARMHVRAVVTTWRGRSTLELSRWCWSTPWWRQARARHVRRGGDPTIIDADITGNDAPPPAPPARNTDPPAVSPLAPHVAPLRTFFASDAAIARALGWPAGACARRNATPAHVGELARLVAVCEHVAPQLPVTRDVGVWLLAPQPRLGGVSPSAWLRERGTLDPDGVRALLR